MYRLVRLSLVTFVLMAIVLGYPAAVPNTLTVAQEGGPKHLSDAAVTCDPDGLQASGAVYRICMPPLAAWNGDLVVYAHGYVSPTEPVDIPEDQMALPDGTPIADVVTSLGFAFVTTSYSRNGLAVLEGVADLVDVVDIFKTRKGVPNKVYLVGISEGGHITTLAVEQHPDVFDGGLAMCGPYGDFGGQINYFGDMRVVFDYFFPGLMPGSPVDIPQSLIDNWDTHYQTVIKPELEDPTNANLVNQLLAVTKASYDPANPNTKSDTIEDVLWYNVFATNDAKVKLGGQPYDNQDRVYSGSDNDGQLNNQILRFTAVPTALNEVSTHYQTSGNLTAALVILHTTGDPVIPFWQATGYRSKTIAAGKSSLHEHIAIDRYGHCNFTPIEVLFAFNRLIEMVNFPVRVFLPMIAKGP